MALPPQHRLLELLAYPHFPRHRLSRWPADLSQDAFGASKSQNVTVDSSEVRGAGPARLPSVRTSPDFESFQNHISSD